jgi:NADP-dependent 3-hydroxy acid dehydrogenase YdfG
MGRVYRKVALAAGAGGRIGGAGALGLGREGAAVVCADIDATAAEATAAQIRAAGGRAAALGLDVRDRSAVDYAIAATEREFGSLDVLLDCAGVNHQTARQMVRQGVGGSIISLTSLLSSPHPGSAYGCLSDS